MSTETGTSLAVARVVKDDPDTVFRAWRPVSTVDPGGFSPIKNHTAINDNAIW